MNSSQIVLQAVLDSSGIGKSDIDKIQKRLDKYPLHLTADLNKKELLKAVKKVVPELEKELKNVTGIDIAINDKAIKRAISQVIKDERRLQAELDRTIKKAEKAQKKFEKTGAIQFSINDSAYSAQIAKLKAQLEQYNVSVYEAEKRTKDLSSTLSSIDTSSSKGLASEFSDLEKQIKAVDEQAEQAQGSLGNLNNIITTLSHKNALKNQISDFKQLTSAAKDLSPEIDNVCDSLENCSDVDFSDVLDGLSDISNQIAGTGQSSNSFGGFLQDAVDTLLEFPSASSIIPSSEDIIRDMVSSIYDIDTAMTSLHMVTDETSTKYDQFLNGATSKAQELGRSVSSLVEQTTNWVKLGFSLDDSAKLGEYSSIYSNISGIDDDTAINNMLTAMKANIHALIHGNMYIEYI